MDMFDLRRVKESADIASILVGVALLALSVLLLTTLGNLQSAFSFFFGVIFVVFGFLAKLGFFWVRLRSWGGLGVILICASVVFFTLSFALYEFSSLKLDDFVYMPRRYTVNSSLDRYKVVFHTESLFTWETQLFLQIAILLLIVGIVAKALDML